MNDRITVTIEQAWWWVHWINPDHILAKATTKWLVRNCVERGIKPLALTAEVVWLVPYRAYQWRLCLVGETADFVSEGDIEPKLHNIVSAAVAAIVKPESGQA